jgi:alpha-glucuronidase
MKKILLLVLSMALFSGVKAENGYDLWLRYQRIPHPSVSDDYQRSIRGVRVFGNTSTSGIIATELITGINGMLGTTIAAGDTMGEDFLVAGTPASMPDMPLSLIDKLKHTGSEGFLIESSNMNGKPVTVIAGNTDIAVLYGSFHYLRLVQTRQSVHNLAIVSVPKMKIRTLNHWDNLNRHVERGYAGESIWDWHRLPGYIDQRYIDYARANASIGINGTVLTNVNSNALVITKPYLEKVAALANVLRPYGIKVYLTARFSAPIEIGNLKTADPLDPQVQQWWKSKVDEIYTYVPDFGGFLVKANSEGQPGPQNYHRSHADGANMLADAVAGHGGIVMWRAFVYSNETPEDRVKQAYDEFHPLDGSFRKNVLVQVKNGPLDFQPREPFSPLFGAMPITPLAMEFQITQEYLGQGTTLAYLAPLYNEVLNADTYAKGSGATVAKVIDGSLEGHELSGMAGVSNIGSDINWTGHVFGQANWYAFGRLAWDHTLSSEQIADEWLKQTFTDDATFITTAKHIMMGSRETVVNYMTPLGLNHLMGTGHHYGPAPWVNDAGRADWNPVYFHKADSQGIGFNRTSTGSNALAQYAPEVCAKFDKINTCPEAYLLWFHHVPWKYKMHSGASLWDELCGKYNEGVDSVRAMQKEWAGLERYIDRERFDHVRMLLAVQEKEAVWWRNACLLYFQTFSKLPIPAKYEKPDQTLEYYKSLRFPNAPGN